MTAPAQLQRRNYAAAVTAFLPCEGEEMHRRTTLCLIRDGATKMKAHCADEVWPIYDVIERAAVANAYRAMPLKQLRDLQLILTLMAGKAHDLDAWCKGADPYA